MRASAHGHPVEGGVVPGHEAERVVGDVEVGEDRAHDVAGAGTRHREDRPLLGDRGQPHPQLRPLGLEPLLHPVEDGGGVAGGGGDEEAVLGQAQDGAVVEDHAVVAAHDAVAHAPDLQARHHVRVEPVEQDRRVGAPHVDLAERRGVHDADRGPHRGALAQHRVGHVLPGVRVVPRALPLADVLELRAGRDVPVVDRRWCARGRRGRRAPVRPARRTRPACRAAGTWSSRGPRRAGRSSSAVMPEAITPEVLPWSCAVPIVV